MSTKTRHYTCCICKEKFEGFGNNPYPLAGKECCTACDFNFVAPVRKYMEVLEKKSKTPNAPYRKYLEMLEKAGIK
jgi:hypothetical protein